MRIFTVGVEKQSGGGERLYAYFLRNALLNVVAYVVFLATGNMDSVKAFHAECSTRFLNKFLEFTKEYENA